MRNLWSGNTCNMTKPQSRQLRQDVLTCIKLSGVTHMLPDRWHWLAESVQWQGC